jgi:hypothetical protein
MVAINPTFVIGPTVLPIVNSTNELALEILNGKFSSQSIPSLARILSPCCGPSYMIHYYEA